MITFYPKCNHYRRPHYLIFSSVIELSQVNTMTWFMTFRTQLWYTWIISFCWKFSHLHEYQVFNPNNKCTDHLKTWLSPSYKFSVPLSMFSQIQIQSALFLQLISYTMKTSILSCYIFLNLHSSWLRKRCRFNQAN